MKTLINCGKYEGEFLSNYTYHWLFYMAKWSGLVNEDVEIVSCCCVEELKVLHTKKQRKIRIAGGLMSYNAHLMRPFCDILVVGEGCKFFIDVKEKGLKKILQNPPEYIMTKKKKTATPSHYIDWSMFPMIRCTKKKAMTLLGRGCKRKCAFCFTSWTTPHQYRKYVPEVPRGYKLLGISNDSDHIHDTKSLAKSMRIEDYLSLSYKECKACVNYRMGVEGFTEYTRKNIFKKPISNEQIGATILKAIKYGHVIKLFFIAGVDRQKDIKEFLEIYGVDKDPKIWPPIFIKATYFTPQPHTPLHAYDIRNIYSYNKSEVRGMLQSYSPRYRLIMRKNAADSIVSACMFRSQNEEQIKEIKKWRNWDEVGKIFSRIEELGWGHLYDQPAPTGVNVNKFSVV